MSTGEADANGGLPRADWDRVLAIAEGEDDPGAVVDVAAWGMSFLVRGLSRSEMNHVLRDDVTEEDAEVYLLSRAILEPACDEEKARTLLRKRAGGVVAILDAVYERSGLGQSFREGQAG